MILRELIKELNYKEIKGIQELEIEGIACDSREVKQGFLFVAILGFNFDGHRFIPDAMKNGAVGLVVDRDVKVGRSLTVIKTRNTRHSLGILASRFYDHPSKNLSVIGIAGTNGKTTITYLTKEILKRAGRKTALLGTISYQLGEDVSPAPWTTPPSLELQAMLKRLVQENFDTVVMEVTSHSLELDRVVGCEFDVAVFNNLTRDHLDFHKTMENYLNAVTKLFNLLKGNGKYAVINVDSPYAEHIIKNTAVEVLKYGIREKADIRAYDIEGSKFTVNTPIGTTTVHIQLPGEHNVYNALAAIGVGITQGIALEVIRDGISQLKNVPGRFERIETGQPFSVVVDYAHTPDALENVLKTARRLIRERVITVFGCGGDRDKTKRPLMGEIAAAHSDIVILTSDNPRGEDPMEIIEEVKLGIERSSSEYLIVEDRFEAIRTALTTAREGDMVLIAGKGHEDYQIIKDKRYHFDDREVVRKLLSCQ